MKRFLPLTLAVCLVAAFPWSLGAAQKPVRISRQVQLIPGPINGAILGSGDRTVAIYGDPRDEPAAVQQVFFTHFRRDVIWAGRRQVEAGAQAMAPEAEREYFEEPGKLWEQFDRIRLKDTQQQTTKMPVRPLPVFRGVKEGDAFKWGGVEIEVLGTPGFTRDSVSYLVEADGRRIAFTGDLIYDGGRIWDLYSFQDRIPEAKIGGYHGYGARLAHLLDSLRKVAERKPDLIVPARGPVIDDPRAAIETLTRRIQRLYRNYLSTNALYWYFKEDRMRACAHRILGEGADFELMPYTHYEEMPAWVAVQSTTRILIAENGSGFMLDCGNQGVIDFAKRLMSQGMVKKIEGIFVTHYHGDHTHFVQAAAAEFGCPIYSTVEYEDILENPGAYHMPAMTPNPMLDVIGRKDGEVMNWHEYKLTFRFYPGQAYYHGALLVERPDFKPIFFVGDAFTPSGMDDYCVLNRNLVHEDTGYLRCFKILREMKEEGDYFIVNEHVPHLFQYTGDQLDYLEGRYRERIAMMAELFPWDDPNYGIDEQWAWFYPYASTAKTGGTVELRFDIWNHSKEERIFSIKPHLPEGFVQLDYALRAQVPGGGKASIPLKVYVSKQAASGLQMVTADVFSGGLDLRRWAEALVTVGE